MASGRPIALPTAAGSTSRVSAPRAAGPRDRGRARCLAHAAQWLGPRILQDAAVEVMEGCWVRAKLCGLVADLRRSERKRAGLETRIASWLDALKARWTDVGSWQRG